MEPNLKLDTRPSPLTPLTHGVSGTWRFPALAIVFGALLFLNGCNDAKQPSAPKDPGVEGVEKTVEKGAVKLTVRVTPKKPRLSDTIVLELTVRADPDIEIKKPDFGKGVNEFTIRDYDVLPEKLEDGKMVRRYRYKLEAQQAGKLLIRSQQVEYIDKKEQEKEPGKRTFILSAPVELFVVTEIEGQTPDLKNLAEMNDAVAFDPRPFPRWAIAVIALVLIAGTAAALYFAKRKRVEVKIAEVIRTPEEIARAELDALLAEKLAEREEFKEFYVRLTGLVRRYIERKTGIHAPEQTTEEFLHDPATRRTFSLDKAQRLAQFLEAADMVKYAAMRPGQRELGESVDRAKEFIGMNAGPTA